MEETYLNTTKSIDNRYRHYKGGIYYKLGEVMNEETQELKVIFLSEESGIHWELSKSKFDGIASNGSKRFSLANL